MPFEVFNPDGTPPPAANYSHGAVITGGRIVLVSGQVGVAMDGSMPTDFAEQCELAWANVERILKSQGGGLHSIARMNAFIDSQANTPVFRTIRDKYVPHKPASTVVVAPLMEPAWKVEIEVTAVLD
ncbi:MAG: RidA family protein [Rhodobiaceae bacterium]|nr:RidA family protein [Rhodobiaceae bacterium]MCC0012038.1 RidA family protein [Rhodobiaceae bacterium]MCC0051505.1 RidA family protein [Rhodobiaceae bacterium]MCC0061046.1 RidA family protein [Rhodobiaceae bacterium]